MKIVKIAGILVVVLVALVGIAAAIVANIDVNKYKPQIVAAAHEATGRTLEIKGDIKLALFPNLAASVSGVSFSNADWGSRKEMVQAGSLSASVALMPLISGNIQIGKVTVKDVDVLLETDRQGRGNWAFAAPSASKPSTETAPKASSAGGAMKLPSIEGVRIENVKLAYRDGVANSITTVAIEQLDLADNKNGMQIALRAAFNGNPIRLDGNLGALADIAAPRTPWPIKISGDIAGAKLGIDGSIREPLAGKGYDLKIDLAAEDVAKLAAIGGASVPQVGPLKAAIHLTATGPQGGPAIPSLKVELGRADLFRLNVDGSVKDVVGQSGIVLALNIDAPDVKAVAKTFGQEIGAQGPISVALKLQDAGPKRYNISDLAAKFGGSDIGGTLNANLSGAKPVLGGQLQSKLLDIAALMPQQKAGAAGKPASNSAPAASGGGSAKPGEARVIPDQPLPYDALNNADADLGYRAELVRLPSANLKNAVVNVSLKGGDLTLRPSADLGGGRFTGDMALSGKAKSLSLKVDGRDINLGALLKESGSSELLTGGKTLLTVDLKGSGNSPHAIAASLNGQAYLNVGEGEIDNRWLNLMSPDISGGFGKVLGGEKTTKLNCVIAKFDMKDGMASAKSLFTDIVKMNVRGEGNVDFGNERPKLKLTPTSNTPSLASLVPPLLVEGTFAAPSVGVDPLGLAASAASAVGSIAGKAGGAVPGLGSVLGAVTGSGAATGGESVPKSCADALALAEGRKLSPAQQQAQPKASAPAQNAVPQIPGAGGVRDAVKGLFGR